MEIKNIKDYDSASIMGEIKRRVKTMKRRRELCSHCKRRRANGVSVLRTRHYSEDNLQLYAIHTIPVCKKCSMKNNLDELNAKKLLEDTGLSLSSIKIDL